MKRILLLFVFSLFIFAMSAQTICYVKADGTGTGASWADVSGNLQAMINASVSGDEVWVANGTYSSVVNGEVTWGFRLKISGVKIYGGFPSSASDPGMIDRDWEAYPTILTGDNTRYVIVLKGNTINDTRKVILK